VFYKLLLVVLVLFCWRVLNRVGASWRIYGFKHGLLAFPRLIFGNILNFCATCMALSRFVEAKVSGKVPEWGKTEHAFPTEDQLRSYRLRLGDILLKQRFVTTAQLEKALEEQQRTGARLGEILVRQGVLWEEDLVFALARQQNESSVEIDPYATPRDVLAIVPQATAEEHGIFPIGLAGDTVVVAASAPDLRKKVRELEDVLHRPVAVRWAAAADIRFAVSRAYEKHLVSFSPSERIGGRLVEKGRITEADLKEALRRQKRSGRRLGDILVDLGLVSAEELEEEETQS
jgi:adsorption protein B